MNVSNEIIKLSPKSVGKVYNIILKHENSISLKEIREKSKLSNRSVRRAVNHLLQLNLIKKLPDLSDLRSYSLILKKE